MTGQWRGGRALAAATYGWTVLAALVAITALASTESPTPGWVLAGISTVLILFGLLLGGAVYTRLARGRWWTTGTVAGVTLAGAASLLVGHLMGVFSAGYAPGYARGDVLSAAGAALLGVGLWQVAATAEWPPSTIRPRQYALAAALGLALAAATGLLAAGARWLLLLWATRLGWWLVPAILAVGVSAARRTGLFRTAAVAVATTGAVVVAVVAQAVGGGTGTAVGCMGVRWGSPTYSVDWSSPGVAWYDGCNGISSTVAPDVAVLGAVMIAVGLLGVAVGARGVPWRDELLDGA